MAELCRFLGIIIAMFADDHNPPHLHVRYGDYEVTITLKDYIVKGNMPAKELKRIFKWMEEHQEDLMNNWHRLQNGEEAYKIEATKK